MHEMEGVRGVVRNTKMVAILYMTRDYELNVNLLHPTFLPHPLPSHFQEVRQGHTSPTFSIHMVSFPALIPQALSNTLTSSTFSFPAANSLHTLPATLAWVSNARRQALSVHVEDATAGVKVDAAAIACVPVLVLVFVLFVVPALVCVLVDVVNVRDKLVSATAPCVDVTFPAFDEEALLLLEACLLLLLLEAILDDEDTGAGAVFVVCAFVLVDFEDGEMVDFETLVVALPTLTEVEDAEILLLELAAACEDDDTETEDEDECEDDTDVSTDLAVVLLLAWDVLDLVVLLLLLAALLLVVGTGTTTGAVLDEKDLEEEEEEEEEVLELTVEGFALTILVVGTGATTGVVLDVVLEDENGAGAGFDEDVLLVGAGAAVDVLEIDT